MTALVDQPLLCTEAENCLSEGMTEDWWGHVKSGSEVSYLLRPETACSLTSILLLSKGSFLISFTAVQGGGWRPQSIPLTHQARFGRLATCRLRQLTPATGTPFEHPRAGPGPVPSSLTLRPALFPAQDHPLFGMSDSGNVTSFRDAVP